MPFETVAPGVRRLAVRTPTLPPATHTNTYVLGDERLVVVDPASPYEDEQGRFVAALGDDLARVDTLFLTHHHHDHVAGALALRDAVRDAGGDPTIQAHPVTRDLLSDTVAVDDLLEDDEGLDVDGRRWAAMLTPGHAPGHLVLYDADAGTMVAGDMVAGIGTILIDPSEGDLGDYLASLAAMQKRRPSVLLPSHGPALEEAEAVLGFYVAHRHQRTEQIRKALATHGAATPQALAPRVYPELPEIAHGIAAVQILAHLKWMDVHGLARPTDDGAWIAV